MENNSTPALESYEIIENENNEIMILIYAGPTEPANSTYTINEYAKHIILKRNSKDTLYIEQLSDEHMQKIKKLNTIYVCELKYNENLKEDEETDIVYAYASTKEIPAQNKKQETYIALRRSQLRTEDHRCSSNRLMLCQEHFLHLLRFLHILLYSFRSSRMLLSFSFFATPLSRVGRTIRPKRIVFFLVNHKSEGG
jgi:hypothetical protein